MANEPCKMDSDCLSGWEVCDTEKKVVDENGVESQGACTHKSLFPMNATEFFGCFVIIFLLAFTNAGGIGGGGIVVPAAIAIYRFDTRNAVTLSNFSIAISTMVRYVLNLKKSHPLKNGTGTVTDYNVTILMVPGIIIGVSLGSIVNLSLPQPIIAIGFILCNMFTAFIGLRNFFRIKKKENLAQVEVEMNELENTERILLQESAST